MAEISTVLLYLALFLAAAKAGSVVAAKFRVPGVLGELVAGIAIGPFVAGWISQQLFGVALYADMASPAGEFMGILGGLGIIVLLFLAGLSIELGEFKRAEKPAVLVAFFGAAVAFLLGFGVGVLFGWNPMQAAFVGAVLAATSVGITVRVLMDLHALHTPVGITVMGAAVIDDIIAIVILSLLSGLALGGLTILGLSERLVLIAVFIAGGIWLGLRVFPRMLSFVGRLHVEEVVLSVALALVFFIGAVAELIGIAALTGAFLAGLVLSGTPVAASLRAKVSTIGYGLLIPLFFVEIGARMDLGTLGAASMLAITLVAVAVLSKIIGCGLGALASGFSPRDSIRVGVGMLPRAEIALVIAAIGVKAGIATPALLSVTITIVLITTLVTPMLASLAFRGPRTGKV